MECPPVLFEVWSLEEESRPFDSPVEIEDKPQEFLN
jgi:hypothetical protein